MTLTILLPDETQVKLEKRAKAIKWSVEKMAAHLLDEALSVTNASLGVNELTPEDVVARILSLPPKPQNIRASVGSLSDALRESKPDYSFDLEGWTQDWAAVEAEMKAIEWADAIAERLE